MAITLPLQVSGWSYGVNHGNDHKKLPKKQCSCVQEVSESVPLRLLLQTLIKAVSFLILVVFWHKAFAASLV